MRRGFLCLLLFFAGCGEKNGKGGEAAFGGIPPEAKVGLDSLIRGKGVFVDRIGGYYVKIFEGWEMRSVGGVFYVHHRYKKGYAGMVAFSKSPLEETFRAIAADLEPYRTQGTEVFLKEKDKGKAILIRNLRFPEKFTLTSARGKHSTLVVLTGGRRYTRVALAVYPVKYDTSLLKELKEILASFHVIPPSERIPFRIDSITDPSGVTAMYIAVPDGYHLQGKVVKMGTSWATTFKIVGDTTGDMLSFDVLSFMSNYAGFLWRTTFTFYNLNGNSWRTGGYVRRTSPSACRSLALNTVWGKGWEVVDWRYEKRKSPPLRIPGGYSKLYTFTLKAVKGDSIRYGLGSCYLSGYETYEGGSSGGFIFMFTVHMSRSRHHDFSHLALSILNTLYYNPRWIQITRNRSLAENRRLNALTMRIIEQRKREAAAFRSYLNSIRREGQLWGEALGAGNEFISDMNTSWANVLGEEVFARDPSTGEVFHLDHAGGEIFRDPEFGSVVEIPPDAYNLQNTLVDMGWRRMERSFWEFK